MQWTVCGYETEVSEAVDNPEEALSPMASGKPPAVGSWGRSIDLKILLEWIYHRRHRSEAFLGKGEAHRRREHCGKCFNLLETRVQNGNDILSLL